MPTITEIAKGLSVTPGRVSQLAKEGMPVTSLNAARRWRENRPRTRRPTNGKFAVEHDEGLGASDKARVGRPSKPRPLPDTGDGLMDALTCAVNVQEKAYEELQKALAHGQTGKIAPFLAIHNKALEARFMAEAEYRKEAERRGILVDKTIMTEICRRVMDPVLRDLKKLPNESGPQCGADPLPNVKILDIAVNKIIAKGRAALVDALKS